MFTKITLLYGPRGGSFSEEYVPKVRIILYQLSIDKNENKQDTQLQAITLVYTLFCHF